MMCCSWAKNYYKSLMSQASQISESRTREELEKNLKSLLGCRLVFLLVFAVIDSVNLGRLWSTYDRIQSGSCAEPPTLPYECESYKTFAVLPVAAGIIALVTTAPVWYRPGVNFSIVAMLGNAVKVVISVVDLAWLCYTAAANNFGWNEELNMIGNAFSAAIYIFFYAYVVYFILLAYSRMKSLGPRSDKDQKQEEFTGLMDSDLPDDMITKADEEVTV